MNKRLKELRKSLKLTQTEFADILHVKQNTVASYESGRIIPSDMVIANICREFKVSEEWIRTGKGEMFIGKKKDFVDMLVDQYNLGQASETLIRTFCELKPEDRKVILNFVIMAADNLQTMNSVVEAAEDAYNRAIKNTSAAEAAYAEALGFAPSMDSSVSNSTNDIQNTKKESLLDEEA